MLVSCNCWTLICVLSSTVEKNTPYYTQKKHGYYLQNFSRLRKLAAVLNFSLSERKMVGPGQIQMCMKKPAVITITDPSVSPWVEGFLGWIGWSRSRRRCQSKTFSKAAIFSSFFIQNLPQCPFSSVSFWHLWQTQFYKSKKIFTGKKCFSVLLLYVYLTIKWRRQEKQNYLP